MNNHRVQMVRIRLSSRAQRILARLGETTDAAEAQRLSQLVLLLEMKIEDDRAEVERHLHPADPVK